MEEPRNFDEIKLANIQVRTNFTLVRTDINRIRTDFLNTGTDALASKLSIAGNTQFEVSIVNEIGRFRAIYTKPCVK